MATPPRTTGPHVVHFSAVKEVVEIESGRFEYFKQMLAMGLAGIAGLAAIFTDSDKIPEEILSKSSLTVFAIADIVVILFAAMGISTYANHLRDVEKLSHDPENDELKDNRQGSENSILTHAKWSLGASGVAAVALIFFAGVQLFKDKVIDTESAMKMARTAITKQSGVNGDFLLDSLNVAGGDFLITYSTSDKTISYKVRVNRETKKILEITKSQ